MTKTVDSVVHTYLYAGGKLLRETYGDTDLDFFYDANGNPFALKVDDTVYYYITNLQGDVLRLVDADGETAAAYTYDPYGKVLTATGTLASVNPLRYRGYYSFLVPWLPFLNNHLSRRCEHEKNRCNMP